MLIGTNIDELDLRVGFDTALLTDEEMALGAEGWLTFQDPFAPLGASGAAAA